MNDRRPFYRKIGYLLAIVGLLLALAWLSPPATTAVGANRGSEGGLLARKRDQFHLSQANLGEIDPTSEAIKLATLGMRGVAANILWGKANEAQKTRDWTTLSATVSQIIKLQPNFVAIWRFQGWNLAYNVSADWDDFRDRYYWVIKGINFINEGMAYNRREPMLPCDKGWFISQKIGRSDERVQFRRLFRADDEFHGDRPVAQRDNWLVGKLAFREAEQLVDQGSPLRSMTPYLFRSHSPRCQINYATALEEDGTFGELARVGWSQAATEWSDFGSQDLPSVTGNTFRLNEFDRYLTELQTLTKKLEDFEPGLREKLAHKKLDQLSEQEREILEKPSDKRTHEEGLLVFQIAEKLDVKWREVAVALSDASKKAEAQQLVNRIALLETSVLEINQARDQLSYPYWQERCNAERTPEAIAAREAIFAGDRAFREADMETARKQFEAGFAEWRKVIDASKTMLEDGATAEEMIDVVRRYRECLKQLDEPFPENFVLDNLVKQHQAYFDTPK